MNRQHLSGPSFTIAIAAAGDGLEIVGQIIQILIPDPAEPATWSRIKALYVEGASPGR